MQFVDLQKQYQCYQKDIDARIQRILKESQYILGPEIVELENCLMQYTGTKHALSVSSGTDALLMILMALGIGPGDEIITSPFTFIATAEVIQLLGAKTVFVDIDPVSYNIDPQKIEACLSPKTKAIVPVSLFGQCADFSAINALARKHSIPVIEDACQSFGATQNGKKSCALSEFSCTSFFPSKPFGCYGDGGMIFTENSTLAEKMKHIRIHGQDRRYHHACLGINGRLDTIQAAILLAKFPHFENEVRLRQEAGIYYSKNLSAIPGIILPQTMQGNTHMYAQFSIQVKNRDALAAKLNSEGIPTAIHYPIPLHLQPVFTHLHQKEGSFPIAEAVAKNILSLPMHAFITREEQDQVITSIRQF